MSTTPSGAERRTAERKRLRVDAIITLAGQPFEVRTIDISSGGMAIVAPANPRPETVLDIRCSIPLRTRGFAAFQARGKVAHSVFTRDEGGFKVGISFFTLSSEASAAIAQFLLG